MIQLLRRTTAYRAIAKDRADGGGTQAALVVFPDGKYLRSLLKECAKAFFGFSDGSRESALIDKELYSDCLFFPAAGAKLTADDASRIVDESLLRPVEGRYKMIVIDGFHTITPLVQNKLLKTLEEPPENVCFLLGAETEYPVLSTVRSRVRKWTEAPFPENLIEDALVRNYGREGARQAAAASGGLYSVAETLLSGGGEQFSLAEEFLTTENPVGFCRKMADYREKKAFLSALTLLLRDMLFVREGQEAYAALKQARSLAQDFPSGALIAAISLVREGEKQIQFNANFAQCLLTLSLSIKKEREKWQKLS